LIRKLLGQRFGADVAENVRILYGGSIKPENVYELMQQPDIDGGLVGGASLSADSFEKIVRFEGQGP
jgi:triosephosphate isomerase